MLKGKIYLIIIVNIVIISNMWIILFIVNIQSTRVIFILLNLQKEYLIMKKILYVVMKKIQTRIM